MRHIRLILTQKGFLKLTKRTLISILIVNFVIVGTGLIYLFNPFIKKTEAVWFDDNWGYRQTVAITNSGSAQTDYQVVITLDTASLTTDKMQADCDDLRVTDVNGRVLPYWIETGTNACDTSTTAIWVKVPSIGTTGNTLYIYYGNPSAVSKQNGSKVFEFFDDFEKYSTSTNIDGLGGWITKRVGGSGSAQVTSQNSRNHLTLSSTAQRTAVVQPVSVSNSGYAIETAVFVSTYTDDICVDLAFTDGNVTANGEVNNGYETCWWGWGNAQTNIRRWDNGSATTLNSPTVSDSQTNSTYYKLTFSWTGSTLKAFKNGSLLVSATDSTYTSRSYIHIGPWYTATTHHDWIGVRKAAATEPSVASPASEEKAPAPVAYWKFDDGTGTNANDSTTNNNDGTLTGTTLPTWQTEDQCVSGKCLFFDGSTSKVGLGDNKFTNAQLSSGTVEVWAKPSQSGTSDRVLEFEGVVFIGEDSSGAGAGKWTFQLYDGDSSKLDGGTKVANQWVHLAMTWNGTTQSVYLNGKLITSGSQGSPVFDSFSRGWYFGTNYDATLTFFKGFIDEPKIYNYARSAAQIQADFNARSNNEGASAVLGASNNQPAALSNGLVGYWKMDESSWNGTTGEAVDSSGNGNNGTSTNSAATTTGKFGNGGGFSGTKYVSVPNTTTYDLTGDFTMAAWIKATSFPSSIAERIFEKRSSGTGWAFGVLGSAVTGSSNKIGYTTIGGVDLYGNTTLSTGTWYHVAVTRSGNNFIFYLNGASDGSTTNSSVPTTNSAVLSIGYGAGSAAYPVDGTLDEARVYNRALSGAEVSQLYNFAPGPVGYWRFDEGSGNANDSSGNANTGTVSGAAYSPGKYGKALNYDGTDDVTTVTNASAIDMNSYAGGITFESWVYADSDGEGDVGQIYQKGTTTYLRTDTQSGSNLDVEASLDLATTDATLNISSGITTGTWNHIVVTYEDDSDDEITIYINGVNKGSSTNGVGAIAADTSDLLIGGTTTANFDGKIDDFKMYGYARTNGQIIEDMNAGHPAPGSPVGTPLGYWKFDEGADNTCSGGSNDACNSGSQGSTLDGANSGSTWSQAGKFGRAYTFDGSNDYVQVADNAALDFGTADFTISAWVRRTSAAGSYEWIISKDLLTTDNTGWRFGINDTNKFMFRDRVAAADVTSTTSFTQNAWTHVAVTRTGTTLRIYLNGIQDASGTISSNFSDTNNLRIGDLSSFPAVDAWTGQIDEVKIYGQALTAEQVKLDMNRGSSQVLGALSDNSTYQVQAANQEYCIPGDSTSCSSPIGRWDFEEGSGTSAYDTSGNANTGTITEATYSKGKVGKSLNFDGSNDIVTVSDVASLDFGGAHTVEAWINFSDLSDYRGIVSKRSGTAVDYAYFVSISPSGKLGSYDGSTEVNGNTTLSANTWYHVAFVRSGSNVLFYVNGAADGSGSQANQAANAHNLLIGAARNDGDKDLFKGKIDQVRVFNYARTAAQVAWDYNKGAPVGHWKFDECQGTTANDSSGNSLSGTITPGSGGQTAVGTCTGSAGTLWKDGVTGKRNYSLDFDGTDDYISLGNPSALQITAAITVTGWIKTTTTADGYVFSRFSHTGGCAPANNGYIMGITTTSANAFFQASNGGTGTASVGTRSLNDGNWHQLVGVFEGTNSLIYVDGKLDKSTAAGVSSIGTPSLNPNIGRSYCYNGPDSGGGFFTGQIDDVRVYNYAFTAKQVQQFYTGGALNFAPSTGAP